MRHVLAICIGFLITNYNSAQFLNSHKTLKSVQNEVQALSKTKDSNAVELSILKAESNLQPVDLFAARKYLNQIESIDSIYLLSHRTEDNYSLEFALVRPPSTKGYIVNQFANYPEANFSKDLQINNLSITLSKKDFGAAVPSRYLELETYAYLSSLGEEGEFKLNQIENLEGKASSILLEEYKMEYLNYRLSNKAFTDIIGENEILNTLYLDQIHTLEIISKNPNLLEKFNKWLNRLSTPYGWFYYSDEYPAQYYTEKVRHIVKNLEGIESPLAKKTVLSLKGAKFIKE